MHVHHDSGHAGHSHGSGAALKTAFLLNLAFTVIEIAGGIWTNSIAVISDAVHDAGDCLSIGVAWYLERLSHRKRTALFTYGYRRFSVLGGLVTGLVLLAGIGFVLVRAIGRLRSPEEVHAPGMIALAVLGIVFNGAAVFRLRGGTGLNRSIVSWHLLEDMLGWVAVLIGSVALYIWNIPIIDPLLSLGIAVFILWNVGRNLKRVVLVFLQTAPHGFDVDAFEAEVLKVPGVRSVHHTHSWSIDGEHHVFSMHLVFAGGASPEDMQAAKCRVREMLAAHQFEHTTLETEREGESCHSP